MQGLALKTDEKEGKKKGKRETVTDVKHDISLSHVLSRKGGNVVKIKTPLGSQSLAIG
jgi:hypothetical protein